MNEPGSSPADARLRAEALDPGSSFLVQAPAGSGKTELLIQRYLRLLGVAQAPEEILAVTFTRKAAAEMRSRIMEALASARARREPDAPHLLTGYRLACEALARDAELGWGLLAQPGRLRVGTIDGVNAWLSGRAPFSAGSATLLQVTDDAQALYQEAARDTVSLAAEADATGQAVTALLRHFDNQAETLVRVLAQMLARRDQWLRHTGAGPGDDPVGLRAELEAALGLLVDQQLHQAAACLPAGLQQSLIQVLGDAAQYLAEQGGDAAGQSWLGRGGFPAPDASDLDCWRVLARSFMTSKGEWRKPRSLNKTVGIRPRDAQAKAAAVEVLDALGQCNGLQAALAGVAALPDPHYSDAQWQVLQALLQILPIAAAMLQQTFAEHGEVDFNQIARDALTALGQQELPSELGLTLDYAVRHILLDEFQDTSRSQYDLLRLLTAGWNDGDGRSLFLVGDPMQSIYRFREADVGVYLDTQVNGIGQLRPKFLQLETNFRADPLLVEWVNAVFSAVLPASGDRVLGAVPFWPSEAFKRAQTGAGVHWATLPYGDRDAEAQRVVSILRASSETWPEETIAVLVRSRAHARRLGPLLRAAGIEFAAPDLELMVEEPVVQDLLALTRALLHRADRSGWLAVLRAPWCGLTLADLEMLAADDHESTICELLQDETRLDRLSAAGRKSAVRVSNALTPWLERRGACALRELIEGTWLWLGGPATLSKADDLELAGEFFDYLDELDTGGDCADIAELHQRLEHRPVSRAAADARVQIMTMHKAKGLEFDTVVLPGLGYSTRRDHRPPLLWQELAGDPPPLVLAPVNPTGEEPDALYSLLWSVEQRRAALEHDRLLYVAATRARKRLWLIAGLAQDGDGQPAPRSGSLLASLWPVCGDQAAADGLPELPPLRREEQSEPDWFEVTLRRLPPDWQLPQFVSAHPPDWTASLPKSETVEYDWARRWSMHVGSVVHRWLEEIALAGVENYEAQRIAAERPRFRRLLQRLGTRQRDLEAATDRVTLALTRCVSEPTGRWLLSSRHRQASAELALSVCDAGHYRILRIDRSFIDEDGARWIVDYKTSAHEGTDVDAFLRSESERYRDQLRDYRDALAASEGGVIRTALYFPLLGVLREVDVDAGEALPGASVSE